MGSCMFDSKEPPKFRKGDIVLVAFPSQTEGAIGIKRRPAVIVSGHRINITSDDVLLVPLTSNQARNYSEATTVEIMMNSPEGREAGLRLDSIVDCSVIATMPKTLLVSIIGRFSPNLIKSVDECIKKCLDMDDSDQDQENDFDSPSRVPRNPRPLSPDTHISLDLPDQQGNILQ